MMKRKLKKKKCRTHEKKKWRKHLLKKKKRRKRENEFNVPERATLQSPGTTQRFFFFFLERKKYIQHASSKDIPRRPFSRAATLKYPTYVKKRLGCITLVQRLLFFSLLFFFFQFFIAQRQDIHAYTICQLFSRRTTHSS